MIVSQILATRKHIVWTTAFKYAADRDSTINAEHRDDHDVLTFLVRGRRSAEWTGSGEKLLECEPFSISRPSDDPERPMTLRAHSDLRMVCYLPRTEDIVRALRLHREVAEGVLGGTGYQKTFESPRNRKDEEVVIRWRTP